MRLGYDIVVEAVSLIAVKNRSIVIFIPIDVEL